MNSRFTDSFKTISLNKRKNKGESIMVNQNWDTDSLFNHKNLDKAKMDWNEIFQLTKRTINNLQSTINEQNNSIATWKTIASVLVAGFYDVVIDLNDNFMTARCLFCDAISWDAKNAVHVPDCHVYRAEFSLGYNGIEYLLNLDNHDENPKDQ